jgi:hypothetical protein
MDELDLFRDFRGGVVTADEDARRRASERLEHELERRQAPVARRSGYAALAVLAVAGATATALFLSAPWSSSPGFLERAEAALATPEDSVLHMKWVVKSSVTEPACSITRGPNEMWIDLESPHRYRAILDDPPPAGAQPRSLACAAGTKREVGGTVDPTCSPDEQANCTTMDTLEFEAPNMLHDTPLQFVLPPDPVVMLREAIRSGNAHHEGRTQLDGRTVERIRIDGPRMSDDGALTSSACAFPSCAFGDAYVDPDTFYPIEMRAPPMVVIAPPEGADPQLPDGVVTGDPGDFGRAVAEIHVADRYLTFEYLPRTEANLALADIRAQHPDANVTEQ